MIPEAAYVHSHREKSGGGGAAGAAAVAGGNRRHGGASRRGGAGAGGRDLSAGRGESAASARRTGGTAADGAVSAGGPDGASGGHGGIRGQGTHRAGLLPHCRALRRGVVGAGDLHRLAGVRRRGAAAARRRLQAPDLPLYLWRAGGRGAGAAVPRGPGDGLAGGVGDHRSPAAAAVPGGRCPAGGGTEYAELRAAAGAGTAGEAGAAEAQLRGHRDGAIAGGGIHPCRRQ